jgi:dienelactone hydrolase
MLFVAASFAQKKDVTFASSDGFELRGSYYSAGKVGPGILMLHQCDADRKIYDALANMLSKAAYNVLAFDFRGLGESRSGEYTNFASQRGKIMGKIPADVDAALKFLTAQDEVHPMRLGVIAGSCAVNEAIHAARRHQGIRALVLLSGGTDADGETYIVNSKIPIFGAASEEDTSAAASIKKIVSSSSNRDSALTLLKGAGHAARMLEKDPYFPADIVIWLRSNLQVAGYSLTR